ncbi:MAG: hypothetical protein K5868_02285 [Lachnospiraceae bacterium]|nr:hypothetical protein [Lachnospiraceae bacterium]
MKLSALGKMKDFWYRIKSGKPAFLLSILAIVLHAFLLTFFCKIQFTIVLKWFFANIVSIFVPGLAISFVLSRNLKGFYRVCFSYALGYVFLVIEYFISALTEQRMTFSCLTIIVFVLSAIVLFFYRKHMRHLLKELLDMDIVDFAIFFVIYLINIFAYSANYLGLEIAPKFYAGNAMQYWANNSVALTKSWPADNLFFVGDRLFYHYFSSISIAFLSKAYGISVFDLSFPLYAFSKTILLAGAVIYMFNTAEANRRTKVLGSVIMLCTAGLDSLTGVTFSGHLFRSPFGFDIGFSFGLLFVSQLYIQTTKKRFDLRDYIITMLFWIMGVGAKAPISSVLLLLVGLLCIYWLFNKSFIMSISYGLSTLFCFFVINYYVVGLLNIAAGESPWRLRVHSIQEIVHPPFSETWDIMCKYAYGLMTKNVVIALIIRVISINPIMLYIFVLSLIAFLVGINRDRMTDIDRVFLWSCIVTSVFGIMLDILIDAGNNSEGYFAMAAFITGGFFCARVYSSCKTSGLLNRDDVCSRHIIMRIISLLILVFCIIRFAWTENMAGGILKSSLVGARNIYYSNYHPDRMKYDGMSTVSQEDAKALWWIRDNTPEDAMVLSDKAVLIDDDIFYLYGLFSERQQYIEGTFLLGEYREYINTEKNTRKDFVKKYYIDNAISSSELREKGISYVIRTKELTPRFKPDNGVRLVFESDTIEVYEVI